MPKARLKARLSKLAEPFLRDRGLQVKIVTYGLAVWLTLSLIAYGVALRAFASSGAGARLAGALHLSGPITSLSTYGFGHSKLFRLSIHGSPELTIPPEIAYPLWAGSPDPIRPLSELLYEGQDVAVEATGDSFPVVLNLVIHLPGSKELKLLDLHDSLGRYGVMQGWARTKATLFFILAALLLPGVYLGRWEWARRKAKEQA